MSEKEIYEIAGARCGAPADASEDHCGVESGGFGLVAVRDDATDEVDAAVVGVIGYYDDDHLEFCDACENRAEEVDEDFECAECAEMAIVYFGKPFVGPYYTVPHDSLRPATPAECLSYQAMLSGASKGSA